MNHRQYTLESQPENESLFVQFVPLRKFKGRRYGYLLEKKVYVCPVLHAYLSDPQSRYQALARLPILDVEIYFSKAAAEKMKADIAAELLSAEQESTTAQPS